MAFSSMFVVLVLCELLLCCEAVSYGPSNGDVRLIHNGTSGIEGILEIYFNDTWGTVCFENFNKYSADTVCRQLGHNKSNTFSPDELEGDCSGMSLPILTDVTCTQANLHILRCPYKVNTDNMCHENDLVYISCNSMSLTSPDIAYFGQLRLRNGTYASQGLLEVYLNGRWGTVCSQFYDDDLANITCRQMGYTNAVAYDRYQWSQVGMTIWLQHFHCSNSSTVCLKDCYRAPTIKNIYCSNKAEVFLVCTFDPSLSSLGVGSKNLCQLTYKKLNTALVVILILIFCAVVLVYLSIFILRVGVAAYHKSDRYKLKESERRYHFKDDYHATLHRNSTVFSEDHNVH